MAVPVVTREDLENLYPGVDLTGFEPTHWVQTSWTGGKREDYVAVGESEGPGIRFGYVPGEDRPRFGILPTGLWKCLVIHGVLKSVVIRYDAFWRSPLDLNGHVYFVEAGENGPIKIGWSQDVERRIGELQVANAHKLRLLGVVPGTMQKERELHGFFAHLRMEAEWFQNSVEIREYLRENGR